MAFLTVKEIAKDLKCSEETIKNLIRTGKLKAFKFGKMYRIEEEDFLEYVNKSKVIKGEKEHE